MCPGTEPLLMMTHPGSLAEALEVVLPCGWRVWAAFEEERVVMLSCSDERVRINGDFGRSSTFGEVCRSLPNARRESLPGFGYMVEVDRNTWLQFYDQRFSRREAPADTARPVAILLRPSP